MRVRYSECDPMGVAHHGSYAAWLEIGRTELLRGLGVTYAELERGGVFLVITRMELAYRRPIFYDDVIEVRTRVAGSSRVKINHEYEVVLIEDGGHGAHRPGAELRPAMIQTAEPLAAGATTLACVGADGRPKAMPDWLARGERA